MNNLMDRLVALFGAPNTPNPSLFFMEYAKATDGYSAEALERGVDILLRNTEYRGWPTIAECTKACSLAAKEIEAMRAKPATTDDKPLPPRTPEECARADAMVAALKKFVKEHATGDRPGSEAKKPIAMNRDYFEGRRSPLGWTWSAPTLAEHIARQDAEKERGE